MLTAYFTLTDGSVKTIALYSWRRWMSSAVICDGSGQVCLLPSLYHTILNLTWRKFGGRLWCGSVDCLFVCDPSAIQFLCLDTVLDSNIQAQTSEVLLPSCSYRAGKFSPSLWGLLSTFRLGFSVDLGSFGHHHWSLMEVVSLTSLGVQCRF